MLPIIAINIVLIIICLYQYTQSQRQLQRSDRRSKLLAVFLNMESYNFSFVEAKQIEEVLVLGYRATDRDYRRIDSVINNSSHIDPFRHFKSRKRNCKYYASSIHLLCAVHPTAINCENCPDFKEKTGLGVTYK